MNQQTAQMTVVQEDQVMMVHPDLEDSFTLVTVAAFDEVWQHNGWEKANLPGEPTASVADATPPEQPKTATSPQKKEE